MNGAQHYKEAQRCLVRATDERNAMADYLVAKAQAHATLALAAATIDAVGFGSPGEVRHEAEWAQVTQ